jgi:phytoene/squalene synthetase
VYFPGLGFETFNNRQKQRIIKDIEHDFAKAKVALSQLPASAKTAVAISFAYYSELLNNLKKHDADYIKQHRVRVSNLKKLQLFAAVRLKQGSL